MCFKIVVLYKKDPFGLFGQPDIQLYITQEPSIFNDAYENQNDF
jgi:hypothetical protein